MSKKKIKKGPVDNDSPMSLYDKAIVILEKEHGPDNKFVKQLKKNKELSIQNKGKSFRELYTERDMFEVRHRNQKKT
tara:strand:+ start:291 stop:521 length:231 start_codon:yes stop_codon:yes gene_type:complete